MRLPCPSHTETIHYLYHMTEHFTAKNSIDIQATGQEVWAALVTPSIMRKYMYGAQVVSDWKEGSPIVFQGMIHGSPYEEKGVILNINPEKQIKYTHWSGLEDLPDLPENYRIWTFDLEQEDDSIKLTMTEEKIPSEKQKVRSDEFWQEMLFNIRRTIEQMRNDIGYFRK